eukprot:gene13861-4686_t
MKKLWQKIKQTPASYAAMWTHVMQRLRRQAPGVGKSHLQTVWCTTFDDSYLGWAGRVADFYPGNATVDWVGTDGYNWAGALQPPHKWGSPEAIFGPALRALAKTAPGVPVA